MAEQIISPGVFTRENDLSFLPQGIGAIGAEIVGPTEKGPAFVPTVLTRGYSEYGARFGASSDASPTYVPMTVRNYLRNAGTVTIVRVLGGGGYKFTNAGGLQALVDSNNKISIVLHPSKHANASNGATGHDLNLTTATTFASQHLLQMLYDFSFLHNNKQMKNHILLLLFLNFLGCFLILFQCM